MPNVSSFSHVASSAAGRTVRKMASDKMSKQNTEFASPLSTLTIEHVSALKDKEELERLLSNHILKDTHQDQSIIDHVDKGSDVWTFYITNVKGIVLSMARRIAGAFKNLHPDVLVQSPKDHAFQRITVQLHDHHPRIRRRK